jgi:hypothetical protein
MLAAGFALVIFAGLSSASSPPNLIIILADDLGHNDVGPGFLGGNSRTLTPNLDAMVKGGVELMQFYTFKYCAPTRGATMSSRYPFHFGFYNNQDANDYGVPLNFTFLPEMLRKSANYSTHMVGKWHLGFRNESLTPTYRGFDTFLGYYHMGEDYYKHTQNIKGGSTCSGIFMDFSNSSGKNVRPYVRPNPFLTIASTDSCYIEKNTCRHEFQDVLKNLTVPTSGDCCNACANNTKCQSWNFNVNASLKETQKHACVLKTVASSPNPGHTWCDSANKGPPPGPTPAPPRPYDDDDYSAILFSREIQRLIRLHVSVHGTGNGSGSVSIFINLCS